MKKTMWLLAVIFLISPIYVWAQSETDVQNDVQNKEMPSHEYRRVEKPWQERQRERAEKRKARKEEERLKQRPKVKLNETMKTTGTADQKAGKIIPDEPQKPVAEENAAVPAPEATPQENSDSDEPMIRVQDFKEPPSKDAGNVQIYRAP